jgi:hypothetical protein
MASAKDVRAGGAFWELFAKTEKLDAALNKSLAKVQALGKSLFATGQDMLRTGIVIAAPLAFAVRTFSDMGSELVDLADRTGLTTTELQELAFAAGQTGASMQELENGLRFMQRAGFQGIGDLERIADTIANTGDAAQRTQLAIEIFGRAGTRMLPLLMNGAAGIRQLREEAHRLGFVLDDATVRSAERFGDEMAVIWQQLKLLTFTIGSSLAPAIQNLMTVIMGAIKAAREFIDVNRFLVVVLGLVAFDLIQTGVRLMIMGPIIRTLATLLGVLKLPLTGFILLIKGAAIAVKFLIATKLTWMAVMSTLAIAVGAAVLFLVSRFIDWRGIVDSLANAFRGMGQILSATFGEVVASLNQGDVLGAFEALTVGIKSLWAEMIRFLVSTFGGFIDGIIRAFNRVSAGIMAVEHVFLRMTGGGGPSAAERQAHFQRQQDTRDALRSRAQREMREMARQAFPGAPELEQQFYDQFWHEHFTQIRLAHERQFPQMWRDLEGGRIQEIEQAIGAMRDNTLTGLLPGLAADAERARRDTAFNFLVRQQMRASQLLNKSITSRVPVPVASSTTGATDAAGTFFASGIQGIGIGTSLIDLQRENNEQNREIIGNLRDIRNREPALAIGP